LTSLRTRIAASYALLIVIIIALGAIAIGVAFRSLLVEQAKAGVTVTSDEVARIAESSNALGFFDSARVLDALVNKEQLDHWASATQYLQVDTPAGNPLGKSSNMGDLHFAPFPNDGTSDRRFTSGTATDGTPLLILDRVVRQNGKPLAIVHVGERLDIIDREVTRARTILGVAAIVAMLAVVIVSIFISGSAIDPIVRLTAEMEQIGSERLDRRLRWKRGDEVGQLAATFDAMLDRLQEAFARERQFISDASHELKTPLTVINANAQLIKRWGDRDPAIRSDSLDAIADESRRLAEMVNGMLTLAKADSGDQIPKEPLAIEPLVTEVVAQSHDRAINKGIDLRAEFHGDRSQILGDGALLRQLVSNLVDNALKFTQHGEIVVAVVPGFGSVRIEVRDTGIGIAPEHVERLFDRFFRGDESHSRSIEGTGLGLAIVRSIARVHGGSVTAQIRPEGGAIFVVELPAYRAAEPTDSATEFLRSFTENQ
jgi:two-component system OmpR family sensor kinase